ncbi:NAD-dependent epimerase/dehydratase family protein [Sulfitobacter sp. 1A05707]|uniref:NAD-dependent epimerase/dehydratase family protein n=1 Tax=Sulfitobacter sp. 1A05707 TaxID=3368560 RepID=UPI003746215A
METDRNRAASSEKRVCVVGGSGFIGTRLCRNLKAAGIPFHILDLKISRQFPELTTKIDIRDRNALSSTLDGDVIIHLAAVHRDDVRDKSLYTQTNVDGTRNICEVAAEKGIDRIVFTSSVAVYGFAKPMTGVDGKIAPFNEYGRTKFEGEQVLRAWHRQDSANRGLTILRPTVVFGEGNRGNVYNLLRQIQSGKFVMIGAGKNTKSMAYVGNVAAFLQALSYADAGYRIFNYTDGPDFDVNTLVSQVNQALKGKFGVGFRLPYGLGMGLGYLADGFARLTGKNLPVSSIRVQKFCSTTSFASNATDYPAFKPPFTLQEGLERTLRAEFIEPDPSLETFYTE